MVEELAATIAREYPGQRGFTRANLFRMRQFYDAYQSDKKVAPLVRQLPWTHHLILLGRTKHREERLFYLLAAIRARWSKRELERQIRTGASLRSLPTTKKVSPLVAQIHPTAIDEFKTVYSLEFFDLAQNPLRTRPHCRQRLSWNASSTNSTLNSRLRQGTQVHDDELSAPRPDPRGNRLPTDPTFRHRTTTRSYPRFSPHGFSRHPP